MGLCGQAQKFWRDEDGATAIEYALLASMLAVVTIGAITTLGNNMSEMWEKINVSVAGAP